MARHAHRASKPGDVDAYKQRLFAKPSQGGFSIGSIYISHLKKRLHPPAVSKMDRRRCDAHGSKPGMGAAVETRIQSTDSAYICTIILWGWRAAALGLPSTFTMYRPFSALNSRVTPAFPLNSGAPVTPHTITAVPTGSSRFAGLIATLLVLPSRLLTRHWYRPFASTHDSTSALQSLSSAALTKPDTVAVTGSGAGAGDGDGDSDPGVMPAALAASVRRPIIIWVSGCSSPRTCRTQHQLESSLNKPF